MSLKNRAKPSAVTSKIPIRLHEIRWAGARELVLRFNEIKNDIRRASLPAETRKLFLTAEVDEEVLEFSEIMSYLLVVPSKQQRRRVHNEWDSNFV